MLLDLNVVRLKNIYLYWNLFDPDLHDDEPMIKNLILQSELVDNKIVYHEYIIGYKPLASSHTVLFI